MKDYSYVFNAHPQYIDSIYQKYIRDPESVEPGWRTFFEGFEFAGNGNAAGSAATAGQDLQKEQAVHSLIFGYRNRGHLLSTTNPIKPRIDRKPHLSLSDFNLEESDLGRKFFAGSEIGMEPATLEDIIKRLNNIYCRDIGFEIAHIDDREKRNWLRDLIESKEISQDFGLSLDKKKRILAKLNGATIFEKFLHTKYIGQKRFSLEGGETTIPAIDAIINEAADQGVREFVLGMAHRGRLNVLANIMQKTYEQIFSEFEGTAIPDLSFGDGDVKYHLGFSSQVRTTGDHMVDLKLAPNPSHLESVNPVVEGFSRAKADILYDSDYDKILPILIHGDAAIAGQGVVYETVQMSQLKGYYTGGTIHFVINNQIGFTTDWDDARSSTYCTAAAGLVQAPVFHVNGDNPEAVIYAVELAVAYRQKFNNDVFIDMVCYRKHGHNEGDDPKFTQPKMYDIISKHPNPREVYVHILDERGDLERDLAQDMEKDFWAELQQRLEMVKQKPLPYTYQEPEEEWRKLRKQTTPEDFEFSPETGIDEKLMRHIIDHLLHIPEGFNQLRKIQRLIKSSKKLISNSQLDWALAEMLAYGSILMDRKDVRMSGQDVKRGTFSHRHSILHDVETGEEINRLSGLSDDQGRFMIYNSLLSEFAVLGFEYGYSLASPNSLVIWEAQFGDFYNGAQVILDQYLFAAESKWRRMSGLVMLLPHGYEGQGPEHSSARLERFLQACAEYNITVVNLTTPANIFHALRRQLERPFRKPLVVMSPKSLLRHPLCVSDMSAFHPGTHFQEYYDDAEVGDQDVKKLRRVIFCSGKVYYDLLERKREQEHTDVAIVRIEQLYPFPKKQLAKIQEKYSEVEKFWVQEEPANMGSWLHIKDLLSLDQNHLIARKASASPATGYKKIHDQQQEEILSKAFA